MSEVFKELAAEMKKAFLDSPAESMLGVMLGLPAFWWVTTRIWVRMMNDKVTLDARGAEAAVINMLREEVSRMAAINTEMARQLNSLQLENQQLKTEITYLRETIDQMTLQLNAIARRREDIPYEPGRNRREDNQ